MARYTLALGTHDPHELAASSDDEAIAEAARHIAVRGDDDLRFNPQEVVTLLGPDGLVTRTGERLDEFMHRSNPLVLSEGGAIQPGDSSSPDCNGD